MSKTILDDIRRKHAKGELYTLSRNHCHELADYMVKTEEELRLMTMAADVEAREADKGREQVAELESQLADAKRNEERARAERRYENQRKLEALHISNKMQTQLNRTREDLATLEAAVRAVRDHRERDGYNDDWGPLRTLFALVPEVKS